jgi:hypothetical protein
VVCGVWCVVCGVWCVVCGVWCVVCGVWCVVCGADMQKKMRQKENNTTTGLPIGSPTIVLTNLDRA